jgi:golgin subfamily A member 4
MEVEEEVILDKRTGKELRKREKPTEGPKMDPTFQTFMKKHGGLAIGGSKFTKVDKPGKRPKRADG